MGYIGNQPQYDITVNKKQYIASAGQDTFSIGYDTYVDVYIDGILLATSEYTATSGFEIVLNVPLTGGEVVQLSGFTTLGIAITVNSIVKTAGDSAPGSTDTYTITMTDGSTSTFNVYNGIDGSVPLVNNLTSTSTTEALTAAQGKVLQDTKQSTLISGTNIKTINGESVLGSGDIALESGGLKSVQVFTTSGTWTKPDGINFIKVYITGGGGGGTGSTSGSSGGGAGATCIKYLDVSMLSTGTVVIGAGGAGQSDGGDSVFTIDAISYIGGKGFGVAVSTVDGGIGGTATNGDLNLRGGGGGANGNASYSRSMSQGGTSYYGGSERGLYDETPTSSGAYGAGGSGNHLGVHAGGMQGIIVIEEYA